LIVAQERSGPGKILKRDRAAGCFGELYQGGKSRLPDRRAAVSGNEPRQLRGLNAHQARKAFPRVAGSVQEILEFLDKQHRQPHSLSCSILVNLA
jgi:hypothetical protein